MLEPNRSSRIMQTVKFRQSQTLLYMYPLNPARRPCLLWARSKPAMLRTSTSWTCSRAMEASSIMPVESSTKPPCINSNASRTQRPLCNPKAGRVSGHPSMTRIKMLQSTTSPVRGLVCSLGQISESFESLRMQLEATCYTRGLGFWSSYSIFSGAVSVLWFSQGYRVRLLCGFRGAALGEHSKSRWETTASR